MAQKTLHLTVTSPTRQLLGPGDFTYLGKYTVPSEWFYGMGLTARTVAGQFRLLALKYDHTWTPHFRLFEYRLPAAFNSALIQTGQWNDIWSGTTQPGQHHNIAWDEPAQRLWSGHCVDYPNSAAMGNWTSALSTRTLPTSSTSGPMQGYWGLEGIGQRAHYGCVARVPAWFQTQQGVGPYVSGFGGYTSLLAQYLQPSLGPTLFFLPDPHGVYPGQLYDVTTANIPATDFRVGADCRSGNPSTDWQAQGFAGRTKDRGIRVTTNVQNHYDTPPGTLASVPANWLSPMPGDPDGFGRWTWGDRYSNALWLDDDAGTQQKHGLLVALSCSSGHAWYQSSDLHFDGRVYELHVYDPARIAEVLAGTRQPFDLRPTSAWEIALPGMGAAGGGSTETNCISGLAFDPATNRLCIRGPAGVYAFEVDL